MSFFFPQSSWNPRFGHPHHASQSSKFFSPYEDEDLAGDAFSDFGLFQPHNNRERVRREQLLREQQYHQQQEQLKQEQLLREKNLREQERKRKLLEQQRLRNEQQRSQQQKIFSKDEEIKAKKVAETENDDSITVSPDEIEIPEVNDAEIVSEFLNHLQPRAAYLDPYTRRRLMQQVIRQYPAELSALKEKRQEQLYNEAVNKKIAEKKFLREKKLQEHQALLKRQLQERKARLRKLLDKVEYRAARKIQTSWRAYHAKVVASKKDSAARVITRFMRRVKAAQELKLVQQSLSQLQSIRQAAEELRKTHHEAAVSEPAVDPVSGQKNKKLLVYQELLLQELLKLDGISSHGSAEIRETRKSVANFINGLLEILDTHKLKNMVNLPSSIENNSASNVNTSTKPEENQNSFKKEEATDGEIVSSHESLPININEPEQKTGSASAEKTTESVGVNSAGDKEAQKSILADGLKQKKRKNKRKGKKIHSKH